MRPPLRIFVSSPGDVMAAREVAAQIIEKLGHEYARFFAIEPYLWEYEPMLASGHFQDSIEPPSHFDAVILILESRLGSPLPVRTDLREYRGLDGRAPVTGTEWEFEEALLAARARGVPDLLVYRSSRKTELDTWDAASRRVVLAQLEALDAFWTRHFADRGSFIAGYSKFKSLEDLAARLEQDLRGCIERRLRTLTPADGTGVVRLWPTAPFRGLEAYDLEHAPIYFGREAAIGAALLRLIGNAQAERPFLLILGASGSGKSSLVRAGVVPRLLVPQRVSGTAFMRRAVFRPSDAREGEDLFAALARCLTTQSADEEGLPELLGHSDSPAELARHLREATAHPGLPFAMVLDRLADAAYARGRMLRFEQAKLILVVDQLEELYTAERVHRDERRSFVRLLAGLLRSGRVWVLATMRADFWHRAGETPELIELADNLGRLDLTAPSPAELSQMIRGPAEAAAVQFETQPSTGIPLNDLIAEQAAGEPGVLPLVSYLLDQLYQKDIQEGGGSTLTYASYHALGGLKGAIATRADAVLAAQPPEVRLALRQVLFALVQISAIEGNVERAVARRAPLSDFPEGTAKRVLVDALLDPAARLLVADASASAGGTASVRLAHEALISEWQTARDYVTANAEALKSRRTLEDRFLRWQALGRQGTSAETHEPEPLARTWHALRSLFGRERGLLTDVDLADARHLLRDFREELTPQLVTYVQRSHEQERRRRYRAVRTATSIAALMALLAIGAAYEARVASEQRDATRQAQLRSLTQMAAASLGDADVPRAMSIILEVLPRTAAKRYTPEALSVFQLARALDSRVQTVPGHGDRVYAAAFSSDGHRIVTASDDKTARVWDVLTGQQLALLSGHGDRVQYAQFAPDGQRVATASWDGTSRVWDVSNGKLLIVLKGHTDHVLTADFSPDGERIVTASRDKTARVWDAATGRQLVVLTGHTDRVYSAAFSPDGGRIVTASADNTARIWDAANGRQTGTLAGHTGAVWTAQFSADGRRVLTASLDKTARVWDAASGSQLMVLRGHDNGVYAATFSPDGRRVATGSIDKTVRLWNAETGEQTKVLVGHSSMVFTVAFSPDGRHLLTASDDGTARLWDTGSERQLVQLQGHTDLLFDAEFSPDGRRIVTASVDRTARVWDTVTGAQLLRIEGHSDAVTSAEFSPDGRRVVTASADRTARVWDATTGAQLLALSGSPQALATAAFSPDGRRIVTSCYDHTAGIWDSATGQRLRNLHGHTDRVVTAAFSPDGTRVVTSSDDKTARIWDAATGRQILVLSGHTDRLETAFYSQDGRRVVTASNDNTTRIWDSESGRQLLVLTGNSLPLDSAAFSPDGRRVVTTSDDKTARIWDAESGRQLLVLAGHTGRLENAVFSPDGERIVTAADDNTAAVWDVRTPDIESQISWAEAAQWDPLSSTERFELGLATSAAHRRWPDSRTQCDELAAAPEDPDRRNTGVILEDVAVDQAADACAQSASGGDARAMYQHGRVMLAKGDSAEARRNLEDAVGKGYRSAAVALARVLSQPQMGVLDVRRALVLEEQAWNSGVPVAAFDLGRLYELGVKSPGSTEYQLAPDATRAWKWYQAGAEVREPHALERLAEREVAAATVARQPAQRNRHLLGAFSYYAQAAERAREQDWPDDAWKNWRYRRASLARVLAREGMMQQVADAYAAARRP